MFKLGSGSLVDFIYLFAFCIPEVSNKATLTLFNIMISKRAMDGDSGSKKGKRKWGQLNGLLKLEFINPESIFYFITGRSNLEIIREINYLTTFIL